MGKTGRKNKNYSPEFKISVIMDMREHRLGYYYYLKQKNKDKYESEKQDMLEIYNTHKGR